MVRKKRWNEEIIEEARRLRETNLSYGEITKKLGVSKSTLHSWIHDIKRPAYLTQEQKKEHLKNIRPLASLAIKAKREKRLKGIREIIKKELETYPLESQELLKSVLAMLYWAEGAKSRGYVMFANTDPRLSLLFITLLRRCYNVDEGKIRIRLHLHYYHKIKETRLFWSKLLGVDESKFGKIYIKRRSLSKRFRKNFAGICFIRYYSEDLRYQLIEMAREVGEKIISGTRSLTG